MILTAFNDLSHLYGFFKWQKKLNSRYFSIKSYQLQYHNQNTTINRLKVRPDRHSSIRLITSYYNKQYIKLYDLLVLTNCKKYPLNRIPFLLHPINLITTMKQSEETLIDKYKPKECQFKTPYGHLAGLEWGRPDAPYKILCNHGWLDNAGSFERLVPFILDHKNNANEYHIIALDNAGVGLSSHKPPGGDYTQFSSVMDMRRVTQQLKWEKVESMISIDLAHPLTRQVHNWNVSIANSIEDHFKCEYHHEDDPTTNIRVPVYSEVDAIKRLMDSHSASLSKQSAEVLLKRGAKKQRWGYTFSRDIRLRYLSLEFRPDDDLMLQYLTGTFRPNLFIIRANRSPYQRPENVRLKYYELFRENCPIFCDVILDGTHHLHMNTPDIVAPEINKFLDDVRSAEQKKVSSNKSNL